MGKRQLEKPPAERVIRVGLTFSGEDERMLRQFYEAGGYTNMNVAVRALVAGALSEYPKWAVFTADRRATYFEFKTLMKEEFAKKLAEIKQSIEDDIALMRGGYGNAD